MSEAVERERDEPGGLLFWAGVVVGGAIVAFAAYHLYTSTPGPRVRNVVTFVIGAGVVHDALWAPAAVLVGAATLLAPAWTRVPIRIGLALSALLVLITWPEVRAYARNDRNPTIVPLDYGASLKVALVVVWVGVVVALVVRAVQRSRTPS